MRKKFSQLHFVLSCVHFGETILSIALCIMWCILENFQFYKNSFLFFAKMQNNFSIALCIICASWRIPDFIRILFFFLQKCKTILSITVCIMCAFWRIPDFMRILLLQKCKTILSIALCIMCAFWRFSKWWLKWVTLQFSLLFPNVIHIFKMCLDSVVAVDKF